MQKWRNFWRRYCPSDVIAIALSADRQEQQNVRKLRGLSQERWEALVNLIDANANAAPLEDIGRLLDLDPQKQEVEALAARGNMTAIVKMLHDRGSQLMDMLIHALSEGKLCVIDVSQMRGGQSLVLSGLILRRIFDRNQQEFTNYDSKTIPTIAVIEEAQAVLNENAPASEPYIAWIKEGRKYDLGALLITQQPGSIPVEILSQGDNWFVFHLLSAADLTSLKRANAHFSDDLLSSLLNEPIPGQGIFWSSVGGKPYPVSLRAMSFEQMYKLRDGDFNRLGGNTFANQLKQIFSSGRQTDIKTYAPNYEAITGVTMEENEPVDIKAQIEANAIDAFTNDKNIIGRIDSDEGIAWGSIKAFLLRQVPEFWDNREQEAYNLVSKVLNKIYGPQNNGWETFKNMANKTYVRTIKRQG